VMKPRVSQALIDVGILLLVRIEYQVNVALPRSHCGSAGVSPSMRTLYPHSAVYSSQSLVTAGRFLVGAEGAEG